MTATERLRQLLDERGVEWEERVWGGKHSVTTFWCARGVRWHYLIEIPDYVPPFDPLARAATLGEEIVRCKDCKRFSLDNSDHDYRSGWWCHRWNTDMVKPDGFCAWGERR